MSAKPVFVELKDESGQPTVGIKVKATDCWELETAVNGKVMFLIDATQVTFTIAGKEVHTAALASLPDSLCFVGKGTDWKLA